MTEIIQRREAPGKDGSKEKPKQQERHNHGLKKRSVRRSESAAGRRVQEATLRGPGLGKIGRERSLEIAPVRWHDRPSPISKVVEE